MPSPTKLAPVLRSRRTWLRVDGVLLLDKPCGMTSNAALQAARRLYSAEKAGHTGTLDPLATGLLPLCFGEATKFSSDLLDADKTYEADVQFGITTTTGDAEGEVLTCCVPCVERQTLEAVLLRFHGEITQVPPMYSALKHAGQPLYKLARQGVEVERTPRVVRISSLDLLESASDRCRLRIRCSKGTYIRTLAEDIGQALACGAHLTALRRVAVGDLSLVRAVTLDALQSADDSERSCHLLAPDALLQNLARVDLEPAFAARFCHGNPVTPGLMPPGRCRVYAEERLLGVGEVGDGLLRPVRLVVG